LTIKYPAPWNRGKAATFSGFEPKKPASPGTYETEINLGDWQSMIDTPDSGRKPGPAKSGGTEPSLEEARLRQQAIGVKLRHMFDEVVNEPVPDEFLDILRRADERKSGGDKA